jgi:hypothetical protein
MTAEIIQRPQDGEAGLSNPQTRLTELNLAYWR